MSAAEFAKMKALEARIEALEKRMPLICDEEPERSAMKQQTAASHTLKLPIKGQAA
jgi:hypothetical protein